MNKLQTFLFIAIALTCSFEIGYGQLLQVRPGDVKVEDVELTVQKTPNFQAGNVNDKRIERPREWIELEAKFEAKVRAEKNAVLKELTIRFYAAIRDVSNQNRPTILTGDVTLLNVLVNEDNYAAVYIAPSTVGKLTGDYRSSDEGAFVAHGVEIFYNGQVVGKWSSDNNVREPFWQKGIATQANTVLPRHKTPFNLLWIDRYPESKIQ